MMQVHVLEQRGQSALVEWMDAAGAHRVFVPADALTFVASEDSAISRAHAGYAVLQAGIPFGDAWELLPLGRSGAEQVAAALRSRGIWTKEDARTRTAQVRAALAEAYSGDLKVILEFARQDP